ncbi:hypothetical protein OG520_44485 (plasmid) [Streptomyces sp. NBC_00984]|uniref:hypothetical protein n=1 Tax=Streptomyces sp. NBC_00984 TaxID=2903700 RepID=UPI003868EAD2|nr:hypothetical protein OG520_44485 [Streptomyces sp. NBC_00984]
MPRLVAGLLTRRAVSACLARSKVKVDAVDLAEPVLLLSPLAAQEEVLLDLREAGQYQCAEARIFKKPIEDSLGRFASDAQPKRLREDGNEGTLPWRTS